MDSNGGAATGERQDSPGQEGGEGERAEPETSVQDEVDYTKPHDALALEFSRKTSKTLTLQVIRVLVFCAIL